MCERLLSGSTSQEARSQSAFFASDELELARTRLHAWRPERRCSPARFQAQGGFTGKPSGYPGSRWRLSYGDAVGFGSRWRSRAALTPALPDIAGSSRWAVSGWVSASAASCFSSFRCLVRLSFRCPQRRRWCRFPGSVRFGRRTAFRYLLAPRASHQSSPEPGC